ncbi:MAG: DUF262 domain-containing protein [Fimbriimonadaceae bacterium]|nr:DUF262 domain-containing protein [Fimbriimonadaceae bacterium]
MPTDNVTNRTFADLFKGRVQFVIPFFQRGYAWQRRNWDDLFTDLQDEILKELDEGTPLSEVEHFFGPIVIQAKDPGPDEIVEYLVVDGQQRITTIYLLLGLIREQIQAKMSYSTQATDYVTELRQVLTNADGVMGDDYRRLKVFSGKGDRLPTYAAVFGSEHKPSSPYYASDVSQYRPGHNLVDDFMKYARRRLTREFTDVPNLWRLAQVLLTCLKVVWIPLREGHDDAQAIFESLNDKGTPLSASELLCSYLFRPLSKSEGFETLHNEQWLDAIKVTGGRELFEEYLRHLFSIDERKMIGKGRKVYVHFKTKNRNLNTGTAREQLARIHELAPLYQQITNPSERPHPELRIRRLLEEIKHTRMDTPNPFFLACLADLKAGGTTADEVVAMFRETLVLLVRRKMTEQQATIYDQMFPILYKKVRFEPDKVRAIQKQFREYGVWTSDQEFSDAFVRRTLYRSRDLEFTRLVLRELDKAMSPHGQYPDYSTLNSIEHVIPQTPDVAWKEYLGTEIRDDYFEVIVNSAGNLCLLSQPANSSVGRNAFEAKQNAYHVASEMTRRIKEHAGPWNLDAVRARSRQLGEMACKIWKWGD